MSAFNISSKVAKGTTNQMVICSNCNHKNIINTQNKFMHSKKKSVICGNCKQSLFIGDIFNFKTGSKLHKINTRYNQETLDKYIWNDKYDNI